MVTVDKRAFGAVLLGRAPFGEAVAAGKIRLDRAPDLVRGFPRWLGPSRFSSYARPMEGLAIAATR